MVDSSLHTGYLFAANKCPLSLSLYPATILLQQQHVSIITLPQLVCQDRSIPYPFQTLWWLCCNWLCQTVAGGGGVQLPDDYYAWSKMSWVPTSALSHAAQTWCQNQWQCSALFTGATKMVLLLTLWVIMITSSIIPFGKHCTPSLVSY